MPTAACRPLSELIDTSEPPSRSFCPAYLATMNDAVEADVDDGAELVDRQIGDQPEAAEARAVHDDVERTDLVEEPLHRGLVGDVDLGGGVRVAQFGRPVARAVAVAVRDRHPAAVGGQGARGRPADPGRRADDDGDPLATVAHPVGLSTAMERVLTSHSRRRKCNSRVVADSTRDRAEDVRFDFRGGAAGSSCTRWCRT